MSSATSLEEQTKHKIRLSRIDVKVINKNKVDFVDPMGHNKSTGDNEVTYRSNIRIG